MTREQIENGKLVLDKLESIDRAINSMESTLNTKTGVTLSSSFTSKFKDELLAWMHNIKKKLEKDLETL